MIINIEFANRHMREVKELTITVKELESCISKYVYTGENRIRDSVVEQTQFPSIAAVFYAYIYDHNILPSPDELVSLYLGQEYYFEVTENTVKVNYEKTVTIVNKEGLIARILRTYPSLVRDFHFYLLALESNLFDGVWYSLEDDYKNGIDIKVRYKKQWFNIALLQNTRRSIFFRNKKRYRHGGKNNDVIYIELDQQESNRCGDFNLYTQKHIETVYSIIAKGGAK